MKLLAFALCLALTTIGAAPRKQPNVLFILIDDLGWMDLACQGNKLVDTPNVDRLATQGMRFTDAYAAAPVCSPTRASIPRPWSAKSSSAQSSRRSRAEGRAIARYYTYQMI